MLRFHHRCVCHPEGDDHGGIRSPLAGGRPSQVMHELQRYLTALGTIAAISPLVGLLGTVVGMIKVFQALQLHGAGNANVLAGGISQALITTAAGIAVAIPALIFHRMFVRKVDEHAVTLEQQGSKLIDIMMGDRTVAEALDDGETQA